MGFGSGSFGAHRSGASAREVVARCLLGCKQVSLDAHHPTAGAGVKR